MKLWNDFVTGDLLTGDLVTGPLINGPHLKYFKRTEFQGRKDEEAREI